MLLNYDLIWNKVIDLPWCTLVASGRTGSDAFQSYLDSHPEIFLIPGSISLHEFWKRSDSTSFYGELNAEDIVDEFIGHHIRYFKTKYEIQERRGSLGENMDQSIDISIPSFRQHLVGLMNAKPLTSRYFMQAVYVAYALAADQDIDEKILFFDHVHRIRKVSDIISDFPDCKVFGMTRDPRAAYVSGVEHWRRHHVQASNPSYPLYILERIVDELQFLANYGENFGVMRMEDLSNNQVMEAACEWLGISFRQEVMKSTWNGLRWWGDCLSDIEPNSTMSETEFANTIRSNKWEQKLNKLDQYVLNYLLYDRLHQCGYPCREHSGIFAAVLIAVLIFVPTTYELRDLSPKNLGTLLLKGQLRMLCSLPYHYINRLRYYLNLLIRRVTKRNFVLPLLVNKKIVADCKPTPLKS